MDSSISSSNSEKTLYRKHRPQALADVSGQQHILGVIKNALSEGKITHAYLFSGPRGTGKTTIARIMAKRLNCLNAQGADPCGNCVQCIAFQNKASLDLIEIDAASNRGIDEIRALKERIALAPTSGKYKIYIIDEVHMLTKEAFNALLKTLEEPPAHAIFILATTELHKIPETIKSRCQTFIFQRATMPLLIERLKKVASFENAQIEDGAVALIATHSEGCFRDAESLLGQVVSMQSANILVADVERMLGVIGYREIQIFTDLLLKKDARGAMEQLRKVIERGASLRRFVDDVTRYLRAVATFAVAQTHGEMFDSQIEETLQAHVKTYSLDNFTKLLRLMLRAKTEMRDVTYEELPLELVIMEWCEETKTTGTTPATPVPVAQTQNPNIPIAKPIMGAPIVTRTAPVQVISNPTGNQNTQSIVMENPLLFEKVAVVWQQFLEKTASLNPLLISTLKDCLPSIVRGNTLYLVTDFSLYKERVSDNNVRGPLEELLASLIGEKILLRVAHKSEVASLNLPVPKSQVAEPIAPVVTSQTSANPTSDALAVFGGELVGG